MVEALSWLFDGLGTAALGFGAKSARRRLLSRRASLRTRTTVYTAGPDPYMTDFHAHLRKVIASARHCIYISGDGGGFEPSAQGKRITESYLAVVRTALRHDVPVLRLQTSPVITDYWCGHLKELVADFPDLFDLRVLTDHSELPQTSMCGIDVDDPTRSVTELMFQMPRYVSGAEERLVACTAVFIEGHQLLAQSVRDRIVTLGTASGLARHLVTGEAVEGFFRGRYYFAYGLDMEAGRMAARCPSAMPVGPAVLRHHRLAFDRGGTYWPGSVANLQQRDGERVYGRLWKLSEADVTTLGAGEDRRGFRPGQVSVDSLDGQTSYEGCHVYLAAPDRDTDTPDHDYLDLLIAAGRSAGLPQEYLDLLATRRAPHSHPDAPPA